MAFIIGWNLILEYIIGAASVARGYSNYLDGIFDNKIQNFFKKINKSIEKKKKNKEFYSNGKRENFE